MLNAIDILFIVDGGALWFRCWNEPQNESNMKFETTKKWYERWNKSTVIDENVGNMRCSIVMLYTAEKEVESNPLKRNPAKKIIREGTKKSVQSSRWRKKTSNAREHIWLIGDVFVTVLLVHFTYTFFDPDITIGEFGEMLKTKVKRTFFSLCIGWTHFN